MRPIRNTDPSIFRLISIRTCEARVWMVPSRNLEKLFGGILARYQELFSIEIYAYFFLGNHLHLLIRAPLGNTDEFCENVHREIARRMNWKLRREGKFWARRYDDIPVANEEDLIEALLYVTTNATRHGLMENSGKWPGLNSFNHLLTERDREFSFYHYSATESEERTSKHTLRLSILPTFIGMSKSERVAKMKELLYDKMRQYKEERLAEGKGFLTLKLITSQIPGEAPQSVSRSKRPVCYTKCLETLIERRKAERLRVQHYMEASFEYRLGRVDASFPEFSFKPPLHRRSRLVPFQPLTSNFLNTHS